MATLRLREWEWEQVTRCSNLLTDKVENKKRRRSSRVTNVLKGAVIGASAIAYRVPGMIPDHE